MGKKARANKKTTQKSADKEEASSINNSTTQLASDGNTVFNVSYYMNNNIQNNQGTTSGAAGGSSRSQTASDKAKSKTEAGTSGAVGGAPAAKPKTSTPDKAKSKTKVTSGGSSRSQTASDKAKSKTEAGTSGAVGGAPAAKPKTSTRDKAKSKTKVTSGAAGGSSRSQTSTPDKAKSKTKETTCSKLSTLFKNSGTEYKMIRVMIHDVEEEMSDQKDEGKQLPGVFRVFDATDWGYLKVFGKGVENVFQPGKSVEVSKVKADNMRELSCDSQDVRMTSKSVKSSIPIEEVEKEEELPSLSEIRKSHGFKKTKLIIFKVGEEKKKIDRFNEFAFVRELAVKNEREDEKMETLEALATYDYKVGQKIKIRVKYNRAEEKFQTSNHCVVKLCDL